MLLFPFNIISIEQMLLKLIKNFQDGKSSSLFLIDLYSYPHILHTLLFHVIFSAFDNIQLETFQQPIETKIFHGI